MNYQNESFSLPYTTCVKRYFRLEMKDIAYVRFLVEAYEGILQMTSLPGRGEVEWIIPQSQANQADALAQALAKEMIFVPIPPPDDWPD